MHHAARLTLRYDGLPVRRPRNMAAVKQPVTNLARTSGPLGCYGTYGTYGTDEAAGRGSVTGTGLHVSLSLAPLGL